MGELKINTELQSMIPPLSEDEFEILQGSIVEEGCREPLIIWDGTIIDGHNRFNICVENNIDFKTVDMVFDTLDDAKVWMIDNQRGRRNLTDGWKYDLFMVKKEILLAQGRAKLSDAGKAGRAKQLGGLFETNKPPETHNTQVKIAGDINWSIAKVAKADKVWKTAETNEDAAQLKEQAKAGDITINKAYETIRKAEKKAALEEKKADIAAQIKESPDAPQIWCESYTTWIGKQPDCDLLLTDPPYSTDVEDITGFAADWLPLALSKVKATGRAYIFIGAYPEELQAYMNVQMPAQILVWTYRNTLGPQPKYDYIRNMQFILYYKMSQCPPLDSPIIMEQISVQDFNHPARSAERYHTWQKPKDLAERFIRHSTKDGDIVMDPFCCTGTFPLTAARLGRIGLGCDIDMDNLKIAEGRGCKMM